MTRTEARNLICEVLAGIAPEANLTALPGKAQMRDELDLDSMDFLNFVAALHERTRIDYPRSGLPAPGHARRRDRVPRPVMGRRGPRWIRPTCVATSS